MTDAQNQAKLKKRIEAIAKLPENNLCADCGKRGKHSRSLYLYMYLFHSTMCILYRSEMGFCQSGYFHVY
jgi:hypothetical protein